MHGRRKRQGPRRGEYCAWPSRQARVGTGNGRIKTFADGPSGRMHRRLPAVLPPPPFPFATEAQAHWQSFHRAAPPSRRGANACAHLMPWIRPPSSHPHRHNPLKSLKGHNFPDVFLPQGRAEARPLRSPRGGTRFCASAVEMPTQIVQGGASRVQKRPSQAFPGVFVSEGRSQKHPIKTTPCLRPPLAPCFAPRARFQTIRPAFSFSPPPSAREGENGIVAARGFGRVRPCMHPRFRIGAGPFRPPWLAPRSWPRPFPPPPPLPPRPPAASWRGTASTSP